MMIFVDSNIFVRYLTQDDPVKGAASLAFFRRVKAGEAALTCEGVISEVVYVLASRTLYNLSPADIRARLIPVLNLRGLRLPHKHVALRALDLYAQHGSLDFEDALCIAHVEHAGLTDILSYDRDIDRIPGITRHEPAPADANTDGLLRDNPT